MVVVDVRVVVTVDVEVVGEVTVDVTVVGDVTVEVTVLVVGEVTVLVTVEVTVVVIVEVGLGYVLVRVVVVVWPPDQRGVPAGNVAKLPPTTI